MFLEISEHFFDPATAPIKAQGHGFVGQIGSQTPGLLFTALPMDQQVDPKDVVASQITAPQPEALSRLLDKAAEGLPTLFFGEAKAGIRLLAQDVEPMPTFELPQDGHSAEFTVADQENCRSSRDQAAHIGQQSQLLDSAAMPSDMRDPSPSDRDRSFAVGQTDNQQLMSAADLGAIYNQSDLAQMSKLRRQPLPGDRLVPDPYPDGWIIQEPTQPTNRAQELRFSWNFPSYLAQGHRSALVDPYQQPGKVSHLRNPLSRPQFPNSLNPCMILAVDRHCSPPDMVLCLNSTLPGVGVPINYYFVKVSGN
jgi:hypothetical protein